MNKVLCSVFFFLIFTASVQAITFTPEQKTILNAVIAADSTATACKVIGDTVCLYGWFNSPSTFIVWKTTTEVSDIADNVNWQNFTPANPSSGAGQDATNWLLACQGKALNLQTLLIGGTSVKSNKANIRAGLQDALTNIPSGANGATKTGGWPAVNLIMQRPGNRFEAAFATGTGTSVSPGQLVLEGVLDSNDVAQLL